MSAPPPALLAMLAQLQAANELLAQARTMLACCIAVHSYDIVIMFKQELDRIWRRPPSILSFLHICNKYGTAIAQIVVAIQWFTDINKNNCRTAQFAQPILLLWVYLSCELVLGMRVWALYKRNIWIGALVLGNLLVGLGFQIFVTAKSKPLPLPQGIGLKGCFTSQGTGLIWIYFAWPLWHSTLVFALTLWRTVSSWRQSGRTPLLQLLIRDGALYFVLVGIANLCNVFYWTLPGIANPALLAPLAVCVTSICASRLVLNLRETAGKSVHTGQSIDLYSSGTGSGSTPRSPMGKKNKHVYSGRQQVTVPLDALQDTTSIYVDMDEKAPIEEIHPMPGKSEQVHVYPGVKYGIYTTTSDRV